jgi:putative Mn2+ efflux pump MntP
MSLPQILLVAVALSFDAMAVATANGARHHRMSHLKALYIALFFGLFQFIMPLLGGFLASALTNFLEGIGPWISFFLLGGIGIRMIMESFKTDDERKVDIKIFYILFLLAVATSIDALVIGISFAFLETSILFASSVIGLITFILSWASVYIGKKIGAQWGKKSEIIGALILLIIGFKILVTHLFF